MKTRNVKRLAAFLLSFVMAFGMCTISAPDKAEAAENIVFTAAADQKDLSPGDTVNLTVSMSGNSGNVYGMIFRIYYDSTVVEPVIGANNLPAITTGGAVPANGTFVQVGPTADQLAGRVNLVVVGNVNAFTDGTLLTASFKVKEDAGAGEFAFGFRDIELSQADATPITDFTVNDQTAGLNVSVPVTGVTLDQTSMTLVKGTSGQLTAAVEPADAAGSVQWTSSNPEIASVDANGLVTANAAGEAVITAQAGGKSASCSVTVTSPLAGIAIVGADGRDTLNKGQTLQLSVQYDPEDTTEDRTVAWTSSDPSVASVDSATGAVTALKEGTTTITATTTQTAEAFTDSMEITVKENHLDQAAASGLVFAGLKDPVFKGQQVYMNDYLTLDAVVESNQITDDITVDWSVEDESVASIDQSGRLTGLKEGATAVKAVIRAVDGSGEEVGVYEVETTVEVREIPLDSIVFDKVITEMKVGETASLGILYNPENTTDDRTAVWESSDPSVISVDNGTLTAQKVGTAVITARVGEKSVSCEITVKESLPDSGSQTGNGTQSGNNGSGSAGSNAEGGNIQTGDMAPVGAWAVALVFAAAAVTAVLVLKRKMR